MKRFIKKIMHVIMTLKVTNISGNKFFFMDISHDVIVTSLSLKPSGNTMAQKRTKTLK